MDMKQDYGNVIVSPGGILQSAGSYKMSFPLRQDTERMKKMSLAWQLKYLELMENLNVITVEVSHTLSPLYLYFSRFTLYPLYLYISQFTISPLYLYSAAPEGPKGRGASLQKGT